MSGTDRELVAHLYRRAGFGATNEELDELSGMEYENLVNELVSPCKNPDFGVREWNRYNPGDGPIVYRNRWIYRMANTRRPLEEKMALFWHHVFATGVGKIEHPNAMGVQIDTLRKVGMSDFKTILITVSKDPAMLFWLDNNENHKDAPNENYGRELLELFSMGVGNYTEDDIKNASRAFTGWTFKQPIPIYPQGAYPTEYEFLSEDHDYSEKTFLGRTGPLNGEDIIEIIVEQDATARFVARHLYNFFVADEFQVPAWNENPPKDPEAISLLTEAFISSKGDIRAVLGVLFKSDFFKRSKFQRVKSPTEFVVGVLKLTGEYCDPSIPAPNYGAATTVMGQELLNPPTVEGWHTGPEWLDAGTLSERINFAVESVSDTHKPRINALVDRVSDQYQEGEMGHDELLEYCLNEFGGLQICQDDLSRIKKSVSEMKQETEERLVRYLQCIVSSPEYQKS